MLQSSCKGNENQKKNKEFEEKYIRNRRLTQNYFITKPSRDLHTTAYAVSPQGANHNSTLYITG
ncbi:MAG: hypothetical protein IJK09_07135, partial [Prevotella sp.]|nr:hypothetical protein [Prevotella sp.]